MSIDLHAIGCRRMWAASLLATLSDYNQRHAKCIRAKSGADAVLAEARRYLESRNGRQVAALAGITMRTDRALALIALPRVEFKARMAVDRDGPQEDAA